MANAGGAWSDARKIVEVDPRQKVTDSHAATVVGNTVGDPFKDTASVSLKPAIKFTTLFGPLVTETASLPAGGRFTPETADAAARGSPQCAPRTSSARRGRDR